MRERSGPMACPVDGTTLVMSERQSIEIDYCPACRGVWLDRGELDKIIERSAGETAPQAPAPAQQHYSDSYRGQTGDYGQQRHHKRRKSFLEDLFD